MRVFPKALRRTAAAALACAMVTGGGLLAGCSSGTQTAADEEAGDAQASAQTVRVGTMPTEDILPLWVAQAEGLTANGTQAEVVVFDSAQALSAAISSGDVDMAMTDIMRAAKLTESGVDMTLEWITLGETADQGRFGVLAPADAPYDDLAGLADYVATEELDEGQGVGVGANTVPEYVFDKLCEEAGAQGIPATEVASLPERYSLVASGQLLAAALPASMLALGEANGLKVIADDTQGANLSQSVMAARSAWAQDEPQLVADVASIWDSAVALITENPDAYRDLLAENANLNASIASSYPISTYPLASVDGEMMHPSAELVQDVLDWMAAKGYGDKAAYDSATGALTVA